MPRTVRDARLESRQARLRLPAQNEPHWRALTEGCHLGYYKGARGGSWIARYRPAGAAYAKKRLGAADDVTDADGVNFLSYREAQEAAQAWFAELRRPLADAPPAAYTVSAAADDYLEAYAAGQTKGGGKSERDTRSSIDAFIRPKLGEIEVSKLTTRQLEAWHREIAKTPPRKRFSAKKTIAFREVDMADDEIVRQRRSSANRVLTTLKAILNRVPREKHGGNEHAWNAVKAFSEVDAPTIRWIEPAEAKRLLNAAADDLRRLATSALLTGARYGELTRLRVRDFSKTGRGIHIMKTKGQKPRFIHLTDEGVRFFGEQCAGKGAEATVFVRASGAPWKKSEQHRPIGEASAAAQIVPAIGFHILRHTYASWLAMRGVPLPVIARQLGHADTRMTERHYAHLAPSYVADTVRNALGGMDLVPPSNVVPIDEPTPPAVERVIDDVLHRSAEGLISVDAA